MQVHVPHDQEREDRTKRISLTVTPTPCLLLKSSALPDEIRAQTPPKGPSPYP